MKGLVTLCLIGTLLTVGYISLTHKSQTAQLAIEVLSDLKLVKKRIRDMLLSNSRNTKPIEKTLSGELQNIERKMKKIETKELHPEESLPILNNLNAIQGPVDEKRANFLSNSLVDSLIETYLKGEIPMNALESLSKRNAQYLDAKEIISAGTQLRSGTKTEKQYPVKSTLNAMKSMILPQYIPPKPELPDMTAPGWKYPEEFIKEDKAHKVPGILPSYSAPEKRFKSISSVYRNYVPGIVSGYPLRSTEQRLMAVRPLYGYTPEVPEMVRVHELPAHAHILPPRYLHTRMLPQSEHTKTVSAIGSSITELPLAQDKVILKSEEEGSIKQKMVGSSNAAESRMYKAPIPAGAKTTPLRTSLTEPEMTERLSMASKANTEGNSAILAGAHSPKTLNTSNTSNTSMKHSETVSELAKPYTHTSLVQETEVREKDEKDIAGKRVKIPKKIGKQPGGPGKVHLPEAPIAITPPKTLPKKSALKQMSIPNTKRHSAADILSASILEEAMKAALFPEKAQAVAETKKTVTKSKSQEAVHLQSKQPVDRSITVTDLPLTTKQVSNASMVSSKPEASLTEGIAEDS
ncbi:hypothetical protein NEOKW01_1419 [Nematocida sp. AWRm80]|nr:hypothetical protein NEOKW01_1419 [Nematocida sp. AWRm80]